MNERQKNNQRPIDREAQKDQPDTTAHNENAAKTDQNNQPGGKSGLEKDPEGQMRDGEEDNA